MLSPQTFAAARVALAERLLSGDQQTHNHSRFRFAFDELRQAQIEAARAGVTVSPYRTLRLKVLLTWALDFVEREAGLMAQCHRDPATGEMDDDDVAVEVADAERWVVEAREALR